MKETSFQSLVAVMLSAQSRDVMTRRATTRLFAEATTPRDMLALEDGRLQELIKDCGLYRMKARNLRAMSAVLLERHRGRVPETRDALMALPGVGRKSADIMLRFVFGAPEIPVDTHVFRVARRLGLARGRTEPQVASELDAAVPARWRWGAHVWLLEHGKAICRSRRPRCPDCLLADLCPKLGLA